MVFSNLLYIERRLISKGRKEVGTCKKNMDTKSAHCIRGDFKTPSNRQKKRKRKKLLPN